MLNYTPALLKETLIQDLQIKEISPIMKLIVRGKKREFISAIGKCLNILLPSEANTSTRSDKLTALWLSPDEWMIFSNEPVSEVSPSTWSSVASKVTLYGASWKLDTNPFCVNGTSTNKSVGVTTSLILGLYPKLGIDMIVSSILCENPG